MRNSGETAAGRARRGIVLRVLSGGVFALAGLLFWTSFDTARGTNIRTDDSLLRTSDLIQAKSRTNALLEQQLAREHGQVDDLAHRAAGQSAGQRRRLDDLARQAGTAPLTGPGLSVTLNDAPPNATARIPGVPEPQPNDLVIHQQDLQAVVNALWRGGARGIQVMDQRLISTSAVRCVGNTLLLQGRVYSPPYTVTAVGDPGQLGKAVQQDPALINSREYVVAYGLGWKTAVQDRITLPGYSGTVEAHYAQPLDQ